MDLCDGRISSSSTGTINMKIHAKEYHPTDVNSAQTVQNCIPEAVIYSLHKHNYDKNSQMQYL